MNRASSATGWVRNPTMKSPDLDAHLASSYELGWTWNPLTGCLNHTPEGLCLGGMFPCYAFRLANGRLKARYLANSNTAPRSYGVPIVEDILTANDPFYPRFWPERLDDIKMMPLPWFKFTAKGIFVCDMGELFGDWIPREWQDKIFKVIELNSQHRFYLLTKQPQNLPKWSPFPENCYVGVTVTNDSMMPAVVKAFDDMWASVRFISFEPLLGQLSKESLKQIRDYVCQWIIIGAQTKPYRPPENSWVQEILSAADHAGISVFLKDNLKPLLDTLNITGGSFGRLTQLTVEALKDTQGLPRQRGWYELRQEMPE